MSLSSTLAPAAADAVWITGSSRGIGRAIAVYLAKQGYALVLHGRQDSPALQQTVLDCQAAGAAWVSSFVGDVADRAAMQTAIEATLQTHGAPYGVVLNAGLSADGAFPALSDGDWDSVIHSNLHGFYNVLKPLVMPMIRRRKAGRILTMASVSGLAGNRGQVNYSAAKAGIIGASKALAVELASRNITVNCIAPGLIQTDMIADVPLAEALKLVPAQRVGQPEEVASLVAYLLQSDAAYLTRQVISVNGGMV